MIFRDLSGAFFQSNVGAEIDGEFQGGLAGLREGLHIDNRADTDIHFQEIIEADRHAAFVPWDLPWDFSWVFSSEDWISFMLAVTRLLMIAEAS